MVHGDDITSDSSGEDCYRFVKAAGRFKVVKRTPSISTTDLVGRMLLCTRGHFIRSLENVLEGKEGDGTEDERVQLGAAMKERMRLYSTNETGKANGVDVYFWSPPPKGEEATGAGAFRLLFGGRGARPGQRVVYVDGGFDLFSSGHIEFLRRVLAAEEELARSKGWYVESAVRDRIDVFGEDYPPAFVVAGVHDDEEINRFSGVNYPIMNIYERGLCVLQCRVSAAGRLLFLPLFPRPFRPIAKRTSPQRRVTDTDDPSTSTPSSSAPRSRPRNPTSRRSRRRRHQPSTTVPPPSWLSHRTRIRRPRPWGSTARSRRTAMNTSTPRPLCSAS